MSYCRWSCDDYQSDVYCYERGHSGLFVTHVANVRVIYNEPLPEPAPFDRKHTEQWLARHRKVSAMLEAARREPIGLPFDGETFDDSTPGETADRLEWLRGLGYRVPQHAIDVLREEQAEMTEKGLT